MRVMRVAAAIAVKIAVVAPLLAGRRCWTPTRRAARRRPRRSTNKDGSGGRKVDGRRGRGRHGGCETNWGAAGRPVYAPKGIPSITCPSTTEDFSDKMTFGLAHYRVTRDKPDWLMTFWLAGPALVAAPQGPAGRQLAGGRGLGRAEHAHPQDVARARRRDREGVYGALGTVGAGATEDPAVQEYLEVVGEEAVGDRAFLQVYMFVSWIAKAGEEIGADKLGGRTPAAFMNTATDVDIPLSPKFTNPGPADVPQQKQLFLKIVQWKGGKLETVTDGTDQGWVNRF